MRNSGVDIDFRSGRPRESVMAEREAHTQQKTDAAVAEAFLTMNALHTEECRAFLRDRILEPCLLRIEQLLQEDPQCQAYLRILHGLEESLTIAKIVLRKHTSLHP